MPTIEINKKDFKKLLGKRKLNNEQIDDLLIYAKSENDGSSGEIIKADCKDTNRPDLWCTEGTVRQIKGAIGKEKGLPRYKIHKSNYQVRVHKGLKSVRPRTACAVVKKIKITEEILKQIIQMQEKISGTFGRNRKEAAIGVYDFDKIKWPIHYKPANIKKTKFTPLDLNKEMSLKKIISRHPKGQEFGHLLKGAKKYPIFVDSNKKVLSMPPIINSNYSGKVTKETKNLFIEVSGFKERYIKVALNSIIAALADRGGEIYQVNVKYSLRDREKHPDFAPKRANLKFKTFRKTSGLNLTKNEIKELLRKSRMNAKIYNNAIIVDYPSYRQDIMHEMDLVEEALISYGYNKIEPEIPSLPVKGSEIKIEKLSRKIREFLIGFGAQEITTFTLTNKDILFNKMNIKGEKCVEIENPVSQNWCVLRNWLTPSVIQFLKNNKTKEYPQRVFEAGTVTTIDPGTETKTKDHKNLVFAISHDKANFTEIKQILQSLMNALKIKFKIQDTEHSSFIPGRVGSIKNKNNKEIGLIGEIHPQVLQNWKLKKPISLFEINIDELMGLN